MRVVRSPDSGGVAFGAEAELVQSTFEVTVCECWSSMTVVLEGAGLELAGDAGPPPLPEQPDRTAINTTTPSPATRRASRRRAFIAGPPRRSPGRCGPPPPPAYRNRGKAVVRTRLALRP